MGALANYTIQHQKVRKMKIHKSELIERLKQTILDLENDDSFEGTLTYTCMVEGLERGEFECQWYLRHGNSEGQGGCSILQPTSKEVDETPPPV